MNKQNHMAASAASSMFRMPGHAQVVGEARQKLGELIAVVAPHLDHRSAHIMRCIAHQVLGKLQAVEESLSGEPAVPIPEGVELERAAKALLSLRLVEDAPTAPMSVHDPAEDLEVIP